MQQQVTLQVNTKTMFKVMIGMMLAVPAAILLTLAVLIPSIAKADTNQTANSNPSFNIPAGYALVPAGGAGTCNGGTSSGSGVVHPVVFSSVLPTSYTTTTNQTHNETNNDYDYEDSFNTTTTRDSNNGNNSNNGNGSNNPTSTVVTTTTTTNTTNSNNTDNSVNDSNNGNNSNNTNNEDAVIVRIVDSFQINPIQP